MAMNELDAIKMEENNIRDNLYNPQYSNHAMNVDPYYNLIKINEDIWNSICVSILQIKEDPTLYFPDSRLKLRKKISRSWKDIEILAKNNKIEYHFGDNANNVFIAGGKVLSTLLTVSCNDTDYFTTKEIHPWEIKTDNNNFIVSPNVITFDYNKQLIKRLYKLPHEIVHSFDIDCCSVLINKDGEIYGTKRFVYSLINGYNTVDFNYFSPSYEWRLIKYSNRGFSVYVPYILNCQNPELLYTKTENGTCVPDSIWSYADVDDILRGSMLKAILINAKGFQKILIASAVGTSGERTVNAFSGNPNVLDDSYQQDNNPKKMMTKLCNNQKSDYDTSSVSCDSISGKININGKFYYLDGSIGYDDQKVPNSYKGIFVIPGERNKGLREFSPSLTSKILNIFISPYRKVNPGEQTTSTFHKIVLENNNEWYQLNKDKLFEDSLYTFLYFSNISHPPSLYDEKVLWFGSDIINLFVYHFARLFLNNRIYSNFNNIEVTTIKIAYGDIRPKSLIYNGEEFIIPQGDSKGIFETLLTINNKYNIFTDKEHDLLVSLYIRSKEGRIPKIETR